MWNMSMARWTESMVLVHRSMNPSLNHSHQIVDGQLRFNGAKGYLGILILTVGYSMGGGD
jgi:hypothetical protein